ncbi:MAG: hypothetical protein ACXWC2_02245 [Ramlibacter sp.]
MHVWMALVLSPMVALGCQSALFALVTPSCSVQTRIGLHVVAAACLVATLAMALLARRSWVAHAAVAAGAGPEVGGPHQTRRFLAASATAVAALSSLVILTMWIAACVLSPCW